MRYEKLYRAVSANIGLKIISLLFALFLWLYVTAQQTEKQAFRAPLELVNVPDSLAVMQEVPSAVEITVRGTKSELLKLRFLSKPKALVDCSLAKRGQVLIPLSPGILKLPAGINLGDVNIEMPRSLSLSFDVVERRYMPVHATFKGEVPKDMTFVGPPTIVPDHVLVSGASSALAGLTTIATDEIDLRNRRGAVSEEVGLRLGGRRVTVIPPKVLVEVELGKRTVRTIADIAPTLLQVEEGLRAECSPPTASLTIEGPEELVKRMVPEDLSIVLNVGNRKRGTYHLRPEVIVPQGIERYTLDVDTFTVTVTPVERKGS
jgi:YbbR domain-containing protein